MSEHVGEKTEQATPRRLEEAVKRGQFPRSPEVQTVFVLAGGMLALSFTGHEIWQRLAGGFAGLLGHLHDLPVTANAMRGFFVNNMLLVAGCVWPVVLATMIGGLLAGGIQSRFQTAPEALTADWNRLNPVQGLKKIFSMRSAPPLLVAVAKIAVVIVLTYSQVVSVLNDPIFYSAVSVGRIARFMAESAFGIVMRVAGALVIIAAIDYAYQFWRTSQDLMMTKQEVKEELKHTEGNPQVKSRQRRRSRLRHTLRRMLADVPRADVVITNPTRLAIALRYDRKTMRAPRIVAKGSRLNAQRIREIAARHQVPIVENKPLARLMFKYGKVGGEIPAQLYAAVAEVLAWVYRVNRYRYYTEGNQIAQRQ
jgi:flagellar biosynthetic protein FlhB